MIPTILMSAWSWLFAPDGSGCVPVPPAAAEVAPMPRRVPALRVPESWGPRIVIPTVKKK